MPIADAELVVANFWRFGEVELSGGDLLGQAIVRDCMFVDEPRSAGRQMLRSSPTKIHPSRQATIRSTVRVRSSNFVIAKFAS